MKQIISYSHVVRPFCVRHLPPFKQGLVEHPSLVEQSTPTNPP